MERRSFLNSSAAAGLAAGSAAASPEANQFFEVKFFQLRNSKLNQRGRLTDFLKNAHLPMTERTGFRAVGYFSQYLGEDSPRIVMVSAFDSLADYQAKLEAKKADKEWTDAARKFGSTDAAPFDRITSRLLRAFDGVPKIEPPKAGAKPRFFDLRTYQAETFSDLREKINMFNTEEVAIFRKVGLNPIFFGETLVGDRMPNLTYMLWYADEAARAKAWAAFSAHPDWKRIRAKKGWSNADIVMTVGNTHLRPLPFSPIR